LAWARGAAEIQAAQELLVRAETARPVAREHARPEVQIRDAGHPPPQDAYLREHRRAFCQELAARPAALGAGQESIQAERSVSERLKVWLAAAQPLGSAAVRLALAARLVARRQEPGGVPLPELLQGASAARMEAPRLPSPAQLEEAPQRLAEQAQAAQHGRALPGAREMQS
jgi:hypothetical protein